MSKYLYTPSDIALFFSFSDFSLSDEKLIRDDLWEKRNEVIEVKFRDNKYKWIKTINQMQLKYGDEVFITEVQVINKVLQELGRSYEITQGLEDSCCIEAFFRFVKLRLIYGRKCDFVRLKLRTLLKDFGYKRRTNALVINIKETMEALQLDCFLKGYEKCDIGLIDLDDMIIIRLKKS